MVHGAIRHPWRLCASDGLSPTAMVQTVEFTVGSSAKYVPRDFHPSLPLWAPVDFHTSLLLLIHIGQGKLTLFVVELWLSQAKPILIYRF